MVCKVPVVLFGPLWEMSQSDDWELEPFQEIVERDGSLRPLCLHHVISLSQVLVNVTSLSQILVNVTI